MRCVNQMSKFFTPRSSYYLALNPTTFDPSLKAWEEQQMDLQKVNESRGRMLSRKSRQAAVYSSASSDEDGRNNRDTAASPTFLQPMDNPSTGGGTFHPSQGILDDSSEDENTIHKTRDRASDSQDNSQPSSEVWTRVQNPKRDRKSSAAGNSDTRRQFPDKMRPENSTQAPLQRRNVQKPAEGMGQEKPKQAPKFKPLLTLRKQQTKLSTIHEKEPPPPWTRWGRQDSWELKKSGKLMRRHALIRLDGTLLTTEEKILRRMLTHQAMTGKKITVQNVRDAGISLNMLGKVTPLSQNDLVNGHHGQMKLLILMLKFFLNIEMTLMRVQQSVSSKGMRWSKNTTSSVRDKTVYLANVAEHITDLCNLMHKPHLSDTQSKHTFAKVIEVQRFRQHPEYYCLKEGTREWEKIKVKPREPDEIVQYEHLKLANMLRTAAERNGEVETAQVSQDANVQQDMLIQIDNTTILQCIDKRTRRLSAEEINAVQKRVVHMHDGAGGITSVAFRVCSAAYANTRRPVVAEKYPELCTVLEMELQRRPKAKEVLLRGSQILYCRDLISMQPAPCIKVNGQFFELDLNVANEWHLLYSLPFVPGVHVCNDLRMNNPLPGHKNVIFMSKNLTSKDMQAFKGVIKQEKYKRAFFFAFNSDVTYDKEVKINSAKNKMMIPCAIEALQTIRRYNMGKNKSKALHETSAKDGADKSDETAQHETSATDGADKGDETAQHDTSATDGADKSEEIAMKTFSEIARHKQEQELKDVARRHEELSKAKKLSMELEAKVSMFKSSNYMGTHCFLESEIQTKVNSFYLTQAIKEQELARFLNWGCGVHRNTAEDREEIELKEDQVSALTTDQVIKMQGWCEELCEIFSEKAKKCSNDFVKSEDEQDWGKNLSTEQKGSMKIELSNKEKILLVPGHFEVFQNNNTPVSGIRETIIHVKTIQIPHTSKSNTKALIVDIGEHPKLMQQKINAIFSDYEVKGKWKISDSITNLFAEEATFADVLLFKHKLQTLLACMRGVATETDRYYLLSLCKSIESMQKPKTFLKEKIDYLLEWAFINITKKGQMPRRGMNIDPNSIVQYQPHQPFVLDQVLRELDDKYNRNDKLNVQEQLRTLMSTASHEIDYCVVDIPHVKDVLQGIRKEVDQVVRLAKDSPHDFVLTQNGLHLQVNSELYELHKLVALLESRPEKAKLEQEKWQELLEHRDLQDILPQVCNVIIACVRKHHNILNYAKLDEWTWYEKLDDWTVRFKTEKEVQMLPSLLLYNNVQLDNITMVHEIAKQFYNAVIQDLPNFSDSTKGLQRGNLVQYVWRLLRGFFLPFNKKDIHNREELDKEISRISKKEHFEKTLFLCTRDEEPGIFNPLMWPIKKPLLKLVIELDLVEILQYLWPLTKNFVHAFENGKHIWDACAPAIWNTAFYEKSNRCLKWFLQDSDHQRYLSGNPSENTRPETDDSVTYTNITDKSAQYVKRRRNVKAGYEYHVNAPKIASEHFKATPWQGAELGVYKGDIVDVEPQNGDTSTVQPSLDIAQAGGKHPQDQHRGNAQKQDFEESSPITQRRVQNEPPKDPNTAQNDTRDGQTPRSPPPHKKQTTTADPTNNPYFITNTNRATPVLLTGG